MAAFSEIGIGWEIGVLSGWGMYGLNLCLELVRRGVSPALFFVNRTFAAAPPPALAEAVADSRKWFAAFEAGPVALPFPMLHALGDQLAFFSGMRGLKGTCNVGVAFCESATVPPANLAVARGFDLLIAGSRWNEAMFTRYGLPTRFCPQGVDLTLFTPGPGDGRFNGRFVVFSGGKLEYRKGQDLVIAAFKRFHARHPDALLVTAWHNPWPEAALEIGKSPHIVAPPQVVAGRLQIAAWMQANGIPADACVDVGPVAHQALPALLRTIDVALLPSRCEGGTNLVAMECMAVGRPVILSRNTGHLDLIRDDNCYSLDLQIPMGEVTGVADLAGWGESVIDEIVAKLETAYTDRADAASRGAAAAAFMQGWGWPQQIDRLLDAVGAL
jgi:glycosyltransferase involved in cell wall biosynthesis